MHGVWGGKYTFVAQHWKRTSLFSFGKNCQTGDMMPKIWNAIIVLTNKLAWWDFILMLYSLSLVKYKLGQMGCFQTSKILNNLWKQIPTESKAATKWKCQIEAKSSAGKTTFNVNWFNADNFNEDQRNWENVKGLKRSNFWHICHTYKWDRHFK